jgi:NUDIX domain
LREAARAAFLDSELLKAGQSHLDEVLEASPGAHDGPVAVLDRVDGSTVHTTCSGYFAALATGDALRAEWEREGFGPLRARAHELAGDEPLRSGRGRAASLGLAVATLHEGRVLLGRRSRELATDPGHWHTAPSGTLEPERPLAHQVAGELEEEIGVTGAGPAKPLGLGFDLPRLRVELCLSLELRSGEFELGEEFIEAAWIDPRGRWPEPLAPAAAAVLALLAGPD